MTISGLGNALSAADIMAMRAAILERNAAISGALPPEPPAKFADSLTGALQHLQERQHTSTASQHNYEVTGTADLASAMVERQKAALALEATLQMRNKLAAAYKEIMNMPV